MYYPTSGLNPSGDYEVTEEMAKLVIKAQVDNKKNLEFIEYCNHLLMTHAVDELHMDKNDIQIWNVKHLENETVFSKN